VRFFAVSRRHETAKLIQPFERCVPQPSAIAPRLCGTEEPDRTTSVETAPDAVCTRAVLLSGHSTKSQTTGALPQLSASPRNRHRVNVA